MRRILAFVLLVAIGLCAGCHDGYATYSFGYGTGPAYCLPPAPVVAVYGHGGHHHHHHHHHRHGCH
jgi:hypothetical protein